ncbi:MAG: M20/M25/M40 family metallo-hydrolase [Gemmatimonadaceae bacterium]|nr:M20/M25/M40 family metallo-hydrolase [Gemmatimonadaceae bacterium]
MTLRSAVVTLAVTPVLLAAQARAIPSDAPITRALEALRAENAWTLEQQRTICEVPAPPFAEHTRALEVQRRFRALGFADARIDSIGNVLAEYRGSALGPTIVLAGHLDTVFPEGTDVRVKVTGTRMAGPGIGDDCRGLAVVMAVGRQLQMQKIPIAGRIILVANVGEEGNGNLRGTRFLYDRELKDAIDHFISVDGTGSGIVHRAVGSTRYRVTFKGPGGHSYGAFGMPNPIHAMGRAIATISDIAVPREPKTTFNVGIVNGGTSVNSIAFEASMEIDMRSEDVAALDATDAKITAAIFAARDAERARWPQSSKALDVVIDTLGIRPTGPAVPIGGPLVATALAAGRAVGFAPTTDASSTDANIPIGRGKSGIEIDGGGDGGGGHSLSEWYDDGADGWKGPQWALLLVTALARGGR